MKVLQGVLKPIMMLRTKKSKNREGNPIIELPEKSHYVEEIEMYSDE